MSIEVKTFDDAAVKKALSQCPKIIQNYVKAQQKALDGQVRVTNKAMAKIRQLSHN